MLTRLDGNQALTEQSDAAQDVKDAVDAVDFAPASTITTGAPMLLKDVNDYLQGGMLLLGALAVVVMIVVLSLAFRVRWRLVPLVVMLVGVIWAFGLLGYSGFQLSLVTIAGLPILIGLGVEFAIQVHNRIEEEILQDAPDRAFAETLVEHRPRPAGRNGRRRHRLPRAARLPGADDPRVRHPARRRHRDAVRRRHRDPGRGPLDPGAHGSPPPNGASRRSSSRACGPSATCPSSWCCRSWC